MDGWMDRRIDKWLYGWNWLHKWRDRYIGGMEGWMDGQVTGWIELIVKLERWVELSGDEIN